MSNMIAGILSMPPCMDQEVGVWLFEWSFDILVSSINNLPPVSRSRWRYYVPASKETALTFFWYWLDNMQQSRVKHDKLEYQIFNWYLNTTNVLKVPRYTVSGISNIHISG